MLNLDRTKCIFLKDNKEVALKLAKELYGMLDDKEYYFSDVEEAIEDACESNLLYYNVLGYLIDDEEIISKTSPPFAPEIYDQDAVGISNCIEWEMLGTIFSRANAKAYKRTL